MDNGKWNIVICLEDVSAGNLAELVDIYYLDFILFGYDLMEIQEIIEDKLKVNLYCCTVIYLFDF